MQYILVHGAWLGSWCWEVVASELRALGHEVSCPDLPISKGTYDAYFQSLENEIKKYDKVVLVAHSMSGILAAPLLDKYSDRISHLFLIAGFVAQNGQSLLDIVLAGGPSEMAMIIHTDEENKTQSLDPVKSREVLCHDCPNEITEWAIAQLQPAAIEPFIRSVQWQDSGTTRNKRTYIICENDRAVHVTTQQKIAADYPCKTVQIKSGHLPFLSIPKKLAQVLTQC